MSRKVGSGIVEKHPNNPNVNKGLNDWDGHVQSLLMVDGVSAALISGIFRQK